jgi:hypothetical protein
MLGGADVHGVDRACVRCFGQRGKAGYVRELRGGYTQSDRGSIHHRAYLRRRFRSLDDAGVLQSHLSAAHDGSAEVLRFGCDSMVEA